MDTLHNLTTIPTEIFCIIALLVEDRQDLYSLLSTSSSTLDKREMIYRDRAKADFAWMARPEDKTWLAHYHQCNRTIFQFDEESGSLSARYIHQQTIVSLIHTPYGPLILDNEGSIYHTESGLKLNNRQYKYISNSAGVILVIDRDNKVYKMVAKNTFVLGFIYQEIRLPLVGELAEIACRYNQVDKSTFYIIRRTNSSVAAIDGSIVQELGIFSSLYCESSGKLILRGTNGSSYVVIKSKSCGQNNRSKRTGRDYIRKPFLCNRNIQTIKPEANALTVQVMTEHNNSLSKEFIHCGSGVIVFYYEQSQATIYRRSVNSKGVLVEYNNQPLRIRAIVVDRDNCLLLTF